MNGYRLHGRSHVEVVRCLRCLPAHIELVIARPLQSFEGANGNVPDGASTYLDETGTTLHVAASEIGSVATGSFLDDSCDGSASSYVGFSPVGLPIHPPASRVSEWIRGSQSDMSMAGLNGTLTRVLISYISSVLVSQFDHILFPILGTSNDILYDFCSCVDSRL